MTCLGCAASVETSSRNAAAVQEAEVNFASERLTISFDPEQAPVNEILADVRQQVKRAGYKIPTLTLTLPITGMTCTNCANTVEGALREAAGVVYASVNFAAEKAHVEYVSGFGARAPIVAAVRNAGYDVIGGDAAQPAAGEEPDSADAPEIAEIGEDSEAAARAAAVRREYRRLLVGVVFTLPLVVISMGRGL